MHRKMKNRKGKDLFMKKKIRLITGFGRHMSKSNVNAFASSSAYFMFLSIIPIIILLCSLLPLTTLQKSDLLKAVSEVMPSPIVPMMSSLIESLYNSTSAYERRGDRNCMVGKQRHAVHHARPKCDERRCGGS